MEKYKIKDEFKIVTKTQIPVAVGTNNDYSPCTLQGEYEIKKITKTLVFFDRFDSNVNWWKMRKNEFEKVAVFDEEEKEERDEEDCVEEIIGFKLLKDAPGIKAGNVFQFNKEDNTWEFENKTYDDEDVLDEEWWAPVYADKYKVRDKIIFLKEFDSRSIGDIREISNIGPDGNGEHWISYLNGRNGGGFRVGGNGYFYGTDFRLATKKEISIVLKKTIEIPNLGCNNITLLYTKDDDKLKIKGRTSSYLMLSYLKNFYQIFDRYSDYELGSYYIHFKDSERVFRIGCEDEGHYVSLNEIRKVINACN